MQTPLQLDIRLQSYERFVNAKKKRTKKKESDHCFGQYLKNNIADIRLISLDHVTNTIICDPSKSTSCYQLHVSLLASNVKYESENLKRVTCIADDNW